MMLYIHVFIYRDICFQDFLFHFCLRRKLDVNNDWEKGWIVSRQIRFANKWQTMRRRHHFVFNAASLYRIGCLDNSVKTAETMSSYRDLSNHLEMKKGPSSMEEEDMILVTNMHNLGIDHWRGIVRLSTSRKHIIEWHWTKKPMTPHLIVANSLRLFDSASFRWHEIWLRWGHLVSAPFWTRVLLFLEVPPC